MKEKTPIAKLNRKEIRIGLRKRKVSKKTNTAKKCQK